MIWIDNSILESVAKCSTQALMRYVFGWTKVEGMILANAGKAIHKAHEKWFATWDLNAAMDAFAEAYERLIASDQEGLDAYDSCQKENLRAILDQYYRMHPKENFPFEPLAENIEKVHSAPLFDDVQFFGLIDLPVREKQTKALYVCDHKNRFGQINEWWTKKFSLTSQFTGYIWLLQKIFGETVPGTYINAVQIVKLPDPVSTKCRIHKVAYADCRLQHVKSQLFITSRSPLAVQNWEQQAKHLAGKFKMLKAAFTSIEMVQYAPDEGRFNNACTFCDFAKWCRADRVPALVEAMFVKDEWKPWESNNG